MTNQVNFQSLVGRIIADEKFARQLLADPEQKITAAEYEARPDPEFHRHLSTTEH